ncbi:MlaD family protein [Actinomadura harenae]|uniref:MCE family protein n=1 Tax=Actinomadura harenae TaxID=2483351 RepID=A0A3M2MA10_9ACTN|nr:MlaD family protein [Actinomadura harenae]RMI46624.1 MCE family protein [Actinomadura harenae]
MLTVGARVKAIVFTLLALFVISYIAITYADLGRFVGLRGYYVVKLELPTTGGLFKGSAVSYRGISVGKVGDLKLTLDGVLAELHISDGAPDIPRDLKAIVANRSAVGEQYVELEPDREGGPYLAQGAVIPRSAATTPVPVEQTLKSMNDLSGTLPLNDLKVVVDELGQAFAGQGPHLQKLLDTSGEFIAASDAAFPQTDELIKNGNVVLKTQNDEAQAFKDFARNSHLLAQTLRSSDGNLRTIFQDGPPAMRETSRLLKEIQPGLPILLANLLTTSRLTDARLPGLETTLANLPKISAIGPSIVQDGKLRLGLINTFFNPQPCTRGYGGTQYRNGTTDLKPVNFNGNAHCSEPASSGINVRGAQNAPHYGVPPAAVPGVDRANLTAAQPIFTAVGLPAMGRESGTSLQQLLGIGQ